MSFRSYLASRRITRSPSGHFTLDARADPDFPDATTWEELREYLERIGAADVAVAAGRRVWDAYLRACRASPSRAGPIALVSAPPADKKTPPPVDADDG